MNKKSLSKRDICTKFITPSLTPAGWDLDTQIREEDGFIDGRICVRGELDARGALCRANHDHRTSPGLMETYRALEADIGQFRTHADYLLQAVLKEVYTPATI